MRDQPTCEPHVRAAGAEATGVRGCGDLDQRKLQKSPHFSDIPSSPQATPHLAAAEQGGAPPPKGQVGAGAWQGTLRETFLL